MDLGDLTGLMGVLVGGAIILTPILAFSARFALKPLIEAWAKARQPSGPEAQLQDRRISLLEAEVQHLHATVRQLGEAVEFRSQLGPGAPAAPALDAVRPERPVDPAR
ncbi:MAG TPA: hypothetical protein VHG91_15050 [Longimicrobium sp.]|nr:hypothetical protein [Longimicrobium sp.]